MVLLGPLLEPGADAVDHQDDLRRVPKEAGDDGALQRLPIGDDEAFPVGAHDGMGGVGDTRPDEGASLAQRRFVHLAQLRTVEERGHLAAVALEDRLGIECEREVRDYRHAAFLP